MIHLTGGIMKSRRLVTTLVLVLSILGSSFIFTNCTPMVTEEQLARLDGLRRDMRRKEDSISLMKKENGDLQSEINALQKKVDNCNDIRNFIQNKMQQWPNVWPSDVKWPAEEPEVESTEE